MSSTYTIVSGQDALYKQLQVIANNLANMSTTGFKSERLMFEHVMAQTRTPEGSIREEVQEPNTFRTQTYVGATNSFTDLSAGSIDVTNNPLDAAIEGEGFFVINTPQGERYTRSGEFSLNAEGDMVMATTGLSVLGDGGAINLAGASRVQIMDDGSVTADGQTVGRLRVVRIAAEDLEREASLLFRPREGATIEDRPDAKVVGGAVEASNVNSVRELTDMVTVSRTFEALQKTRESESKMSRARADAFGKG